MTKKIKKKWYAIKSIDGTIIDKVVESWDECKEIVYHHIAVYKSFPNKDDAYKYLIDMDEYEATKKEEFVRREMENRHKYKEKKKEMITYMVTIDKELTSRFDLRLKRMNYTAEQVLADFIKEYVS